MKIYLSILLILICGVGVFGQAPSAPPKEDVKGKPPKGWELLTFTFTDDEKEMVVN